MRKQFEITRRDIPIKADEHAAVELSDETLDQVTGGVRKAGGDPGTSGRSYLVYTFGTVF